MNNLEILRDTVIQGVSSNTNHIRRLLDLEGVKNWERIKLDLMDVGFRWYVNAKRLNKFKYFAIARGRHYRESNYIGDIPDFAIDRAELALSLGIKGLTVHSTQPLPITRIVTDPIMVGWQ